MLRLAGPGWVLPAPGISHDDGGVFWLWVMLVRFQVGMVYGALPPEARRSQAALFNAAADSQQRYSVLTASDAIGMGLNLNIRRLVLTSLVGGSGSCIMHRVP
jgi:superfamily II DNA/RNA helicase